MDNLPKGCLLRDVRPPPVSRCKYSLSPTDYSILKSAYEHAMMAKNKISSQQESLLNTELGLLRRFIYKTGSQFRADKFLGEMKKISRSCKTFQTLDIVKELNWLLEDWTTDATHASSNMMLYFPSSQMLEYVLCRVIGAALAYKYTVDHLISCYILIRERLGIGEFVPTMVAIAAILSRIWVLTRGQLNQLISIYPRLYACYVIFHRFDGIHRIEGDIGFPSDISEIMPLKNRGISNQIQQEMEENVESQPGSAVDLGELVVRESTKPLSLIAHDTDNSSRSETAKPKTSKPAVVQRNKEMNFTVPKSKSSIKTKALLKRFKKCNDPEKFKELISQTSTSDEIRSHKELQKVFSNVNKKISHQVGKQQQIKVFIKCKKRIIKTIKMLK